MSNASDFVIKNGVLEKYVGSGGDVIVPEGVTAIGDESFFRCDSLTGIILTKGVTSIGNKAFDWCRNLKNVSIPDGVTTIGNNAFGQCEKLVSAEIPESVTVIDYMAFYGCKSLKEIRIPEHVTEIKGSTFNGCCSLTNVAFPKDLTGIENEAFNGCSNLTEIMLPNGLTRIGIRAFCKCESLSAITIPEKTTEISLGAFEECRNLTRITISDSVTSIGKAAFKRCSSLTEITIPNSVSRIEDSTFKECESITEVSIPESVTEIGKETFYACQNLKRIHLPDSIAKIGENAFALCPVLSEIGVSDHAGKYRTIDGVLFSKDGKKLIAFPAGYGKQSYIVPEQTEQIAPSAFYGAEQLNQVILPQSLKSIGGNAFKRTGITFATVPKSVEKLPQKAFNASASIQIDIFTSIPCTIPYVAVYSADMVGALVHPVYIGGPLNDIPAKQKNAAVNGFFYALQHEVTEILPYKQSYLDHIRKNSKTYAKQAETDEYVLHVMIEEDLLKQQEIETLLEAYDGKDRPDIIAELLDVQQARFGGRKDDLSLSDNDPEMKRRMKMEARREAIKDQKGIKGIVFVQTGDMLCFGYYDEYTGAKDMTDLKEFIEARGGFLRSAVSSNTDYLICNDPNSDTVKSQKAKELGVPVITEDQFLKMAEEK